MVQVSSLDEQKRHGANNYKSFWGGVRKWDRERFIPRSNLQNRISVSHWQSRHFFYEGKFLPVDYKDNVGDCKVLRETASQQQKSTVWTSLNHPAMLRSWFAPNEILGLNINSSASSRGTMSRVAAGGGQAGLVYWALAGMQGWNRTPVLPSGQPTLSHHISSSPVSWNSSGLRIRTVKEHRDTFPACVCVCVSVCACLLLAGKTWLIK